MSDQSQRYNELNNVVDPKGWIGEAFKLLEEDIEEFKVESLQRFDSMERKLDIILQHITGMSGDK